MGEQVIRHRGGGRDENGQLIPDTAVPLEAFGVAPGAGSERLERGRDSENIACTVYFLTGFVDLTSADELSVRGKRYRIIVDDWRSPWSGSRVGGLEVACMRSQG